MFQDLKKLYLKCHDRRVPFFRTLLRYTYNRSKGINLLASPNTIIRGLQNIETKGLLQVGFSSPNFVHRYDRPFLTVEGRMIVEGDCHIAQGCRLEVGRLAKVIIGNGTYIHPFSKIIAVKEVRIGRDCAISWDVDFIDHDFHLIGYGVSYKDTSSGIRVGDRVWIGAGATLLAGSEIADGCVVAANSTLRGKFEEPNCLIAGNPARVIRNNVIWK